MKNTIVSGLCFISILGQACPEKPDPVILSQEVENFQIIPETINISIGDAYQLGVKFISSYRGDKTVDWISSDELIAKVDEDGYLKAVKQGEANIIVASSNGKFAVCGVIVKD